MLKDCKLRLRGYILNFMESKKGFNLLKSFRYAFEGMSSGIKSETNWKIGVLEAIIVIFAGIFFQISKTEWIIVILLIGVVLYAELCNSAIETIVDSFTENVHPQAKIAKDFSAGSVVILIVAAGIIGFIIFLPYIKNYLNL